MAEPSHAARRVLATVCVALVAAACASPVLLPPLALLESDGAAVSGCAAAASCQAVEGYTRDKAACLLDGGRAVAAAIPAVAKLASTSPEAARAALAATYGEQLREPAPIPPPAAPSSAPLEPLQAELLLRAAKDQSLIRQSMKLAGAIRDERREARFFWMLREQCRLLRDNEIFLGRYLRAYPRFPSDGRLRNALLILVQHSKRDTYRKKLSAREMRQSLTDGTPLPEEIASLSDRLEIDAGRPQRFGSRFDCSEAKAVFDPPLADIPQSRALRSRYHMATLEARQAEMTAACASAIRR